MKRFLIIGLIIVSALTNCDSVAKNLLKVDPFIGETEPPKVIFSNPASGMQNLPTNQSFSIGFSRPMNINSCQLAFTISPSTPGFFSNTAGLILTFTPTSALNAGTYTFNLTKACEDPDGMDIQNPFSASVAVGTSTGSLGSNPTISGMYVYAGTSSACNTSNAALTDFLNGNVQNACMGNPSQNQILINFSRPMNTQTTNSAISISPSVSGSYTWTSNTILTITLDSALNLNQRYTVVVGASATDQNNIAMKQSVQSSFYVGSGNANPGVSSMTVLSGSQAGCQAGIGSATNFLTSTVNNGCVGNPTNNTITFNFTTPMDTQSTQNAVSFSPSIPGSFSWSNGNQTLTLVSDSTLSFGTRYQVGVGTSAQSSSLISMQQAVVGSFVAGALNSAPIVQAVGLASQTGAPGCSTTYPGTGSSTGGDWNLGFCWWDSSLPVLSPSSYKFRGGDDGAATATSCADQTTDDFRLVFNNYMDTGTTASAVSLSRVSGTSTVIRLSTWSWSDCQVSYPFGCRVLDLKFAEIEASCGGNGAFGASGDYNLTKAGLDFTNAYAPIAVDPNSPVYTIEVNSSATDVNGRSLSSPFTFSAVSQ
ncbi:hypothetical protein CH352_05070 [Leptospira hartskeerlii]|uniref:SbsA Ig-like domain-containing protein n=1 Tax=Leptospira hartskeerlii TaxID=2023177 RepID=A0A2M9XG46_9LEPT|nr:Ig-like domain-containing protein [Leptospira hartskeerlii]PJZ26552.1 hypothetical protein CH357_03385 [Leptospira hartskeerlii]PJZ34965.1 hypothetical protein CH352_05070 [Leptospira hartskeerlii]